MITSIALDREKKLFRFRHMNLAPGEKWAHFKPPLLAFWRSKRGGFYPHFNPHFWLFRGPGQQLWGPPGRTHKCKRGAKIFDPSRGENGKNFSLQLIFQQIAWVGVSAPVENRALRAVFAIFLGFARFWAGLNPTFNSHFCFLGGDLPPLFNPHFRLLNPHVSPGASSGRAAAVGSGAAAARPGLRSATQCTTLLAVVWPRPRTSSVGWVVASTYILGWGGCAARFLTCLIHPPQQGNTTRVPVVCMLIDLRSIDADCSR